MKITFIGHGYVGLVTAAIFADFGNTVYVVGRTPKKIENLKEGIIPIYEPGLSEMVKKNIQAKRLFFTLDYVPAVPESDIVFIAVGTPSTASGKADLSSIFEVTEKIGRNLEGYTVVATKSTVPMGTNRKIKEMIQKVKPQHADFDIASVPEFLREGSAISDTLAPDRVVIGVESDKAKEILVELHRPIDGKTIITNIETAEMIKYSANSFLATKISFANAIARLSELFEADGLTVLEGIGIDSRIGKDFLQPGAGYGGSCFPKDVKALISLASSAGYDFSLLRAVEEVNKQAKQNVVNKIISLVSDLKEKAKIGILGLAFKANTDDMRDAPSIDIIKDLKSKGFEIKAYDPKAMDNAKKIIKGIEFCKNVYKAIEGANILVVLTEWNEFREIDFEKVKNIMKKPIIVDARNIYDAGRLKALGFIYQGIGRH